MANSVDPEQTAPIGASCSNSILGTRQMLMHEKTCVIPILSDEDKLSCSRPQHCATGVFLIRNPMVSPAPGFVRKWENRIPGLFQDFPFFKDSISFQFCIKQR